jgi:uncharacterized protein
MSKNPTAKLQTLERLLQDLGAVAVAVSGGVDSMTLACLSGRTLGSASVMFHAVSPAVPPEATARVSRYAAQEGWCLHLIEAGEFADTRYLNNPLDRCFYCKTHLYQSIAQRTRATIISGANQDDLNDYRPGLIAASHYGVRHPLIEAGIDKATLRTLARQLGLTELAELPSSPCLSSRVETGLRIQATVLTLIHQVERLVARELQPQTVRCRIRHHGIAIELDQGSLVALLAGDQNYLLSAVETLCQRAGLEPFLGFEPYRTGSAFLRTDG